MPAGFDNKTRALMLLLTVAAAGAGLPQAAHSQSLSPSEDSSDAVTTTVAVEPDSTYIRPPRTVKLHNYVFDAYGPFPVAITAFAAGINQLTDNPPEWQQGAEGYGKRFGSDFGIAAVGTTTRYALAEAFHEDTLYYRCECRGFVPRLGHAVLSTLTSRKGDDGHRVFSFPALVAPYAGTMAAVYGWYPARFGAKDAFRMGNYSLLAYAGGNIGLEFIYSGPHSLLTRMHLNNAHGSPVEGPNK